MRVVDLMTADVITASPETPIKAAARLMVRNKVSGLPVCDEDNCVVGIITERDFMNVAAELMEADRTFARETAERGVEGWVAWFAEDGAMYLPGGEPVRGAEAIREVMATFLDAPGNSLRWEPSEARPGTGGDMGYTVGRYESQREGADGEVSRSTGTYLTVWSRQDDGSWKVVADLGNMDPPASPQAD